MWHLVRDAFEKGFSDESLAGTLLVLILKVDHPVHLKNFRTISLCNMAYKVITKVVVQRLRPFLDELIGPLQNSFIPGRRTADNAILAQEVIHYMHHNKSKKRVIAFKIDIEKAYERVCWDFLELTLVDFGFPTSLVARSLRQGDSLSPYLFVLCIEKLSLSIQQKVDSGAWHPIHVSKGGPEFSHLLFADDVLVGRYITTTKIGSIFTGVYRIHRD